MPLTPATPSVDKPEHNAARHIRTPRPHKPGTRPEPYHVGHHKHVERSYDKHSKLYHAELFNWHDLYDSQLSYEGSVVTRSQTAFNRIGIDDTLTELFENKTLHHPPDLPHLVITMKDGTYGAIPRTIITRSFAENLELNNTLCKVVDIYRTFEPLNPYKEKQKAKPSLFKRLFSTRKKSASEEVKVEVKEDNVNDEDNRGEIEESCSNQNSMEISPIMDEPVRFTESLIHEGNLTMSRQNEPSMEESVRFTEPLIHESNLTISRQNEPSMEESVRFTEPLIHESNLSLSRENTPLVRDSLFSQENFQNLSLMNASSSCVVKPPSFYVVENSVSHPPKDSLEENGEESVGENREKQSPLKSVFSVGKKRLRSPSPDSRCLLKDRLKSPLVHLPMRTPFGKFTED